VKIPSLGFLGGLLMISGSAGPTPKATAGKASVAKLMYGICAGSRGIGKPNKTPVPSTISSTRLHCSRNIRCFFMLSYYFLYAFIGTAPIIDAFVTYLNFYVPGLGVGQTLTPLGISTAAIVLWMFTAINVVGVKWGGLYSVITTVGKIIPLLVLAAVGLAFMNFGNFSPFMAYGWTGVTLAMAFEFWASTGFESVRLRKGRVQIMSRLMSKGHANDK
jgi:amino acid transporter